MTENLSFKYSVQRVLFDVSNCAAVSYAASTFLQKGYSAATVGVILFSSCFFSFIFQPFVASAADRSKKNIIPFLITIQTLIAAVCFALAAFIELPSPIFAMLYCIGIMVLDMNVSLFNALSVYYNSRNYKINYGLGRGLGALGYAIASLSFGFIMNSHGYMYVMGIAIVFMISLALVTLTFPKDNMTSVDTVEKEAPVNLLVFVKSHPWFSFSLFGIALLSLVHIMIENYLIEVVSRIGGNSSSVGIALFVATFVEAPMMIIYLKIQKKIGINSILLIAGFSYLLKAILFATGKSLNVIYAAQILQATSYTFLSSVQVYYSNECTGKADMVKGQSLAAAAYTLGCAIGDLVGGILIASLGVVNMLFSTIIFSLIGTLILMISVPKAIKLRKQVL